MEKVGVAVVGALILIILIVGWANRGKREQERGGQDSRDTGAELQSNINGTEDGTEIFEPLSGPGDDSKDESMEDPALVKTDVDEGSGRVIVNAEDLLGTDDEDAGALGDIPTPAPEPRPTAKRHKLKNGETLSHLAQRYLGNAGRWRDIVKANPGLEPARVPVGAEIIIPERRVEESVAGSSRARPAKPGAAAPANRPSFIRTGYVDRYAQTSGKAGPSAPKTLAKNQYKVKSGDTLGGIAQKLLGSAGKAQLIFEANRSQMRNPNDLRVGWVLEIPGID